MSAAKKRRARELAMQVLFLWDVNQTNDPTLAGHVADDVAGDDDELRREALRMAAGAHEARQTTDPWVERLAPQWPPRRQPVVDRNILRLGVWEMTANQTPPRVVIDECVEMAKRFSTEQSHAFINGVLDAVMKEVQSLTKE